MRQASGIHLRARRDITDRATTHDSEPWLPRDFVYAAAIVARPSDAGSADFLPESHEVSSHMPLGQQRSLAQTGTYGNENISIIFTNCTKTYL